MANICNLLQFYTCNRYQLLREAGVTEIDEANGGECADHFVSCRLQVRIVQLVVFDTHRQRREIYDRNRRHLNDHQLAYCDVSLLISCLQQLVTTGK